jgi:uncharacterized membrane protein
VSARDREDVEMKKNVEDWERGLSLAAGVMLLVHGFRSKRMRGPLLTAGVGLVGRGLTGYCPANAALGRQRRRDDTRVALGGDGGIRLEESVTIARPAAELYERWRRLDQLPQILPHIERVDVTDGQRSHWVMRGPAGFTFQWDAEIINDEPPHKIAWRSLPGSDIATAGSVTFHERARGGQPVTEVAVTLQYDAIGGKAGDALAYFTGQSPRSSLREDLRRFKATIETAESPTAKPQPAGERSTFFTAVGGVQGGRSAGKANTR